VLAAQLAEVIIACQDEFSGFEIHGDDIVR
jgi:hypothetical protein